MKYSEASKLVAADLHGTELICILDRNGVTKTMTTATLKSLMPISQGVGLLLANPKTPTGYRFADPTGELPEPVPVSTPTVTAWQAASTTSMYAAWTDNQPQGADAFILNVTETSGGATVPGSPFRMSGANDYTITDLSPGTSYTLSMLAEAAGERSTATAPVSASTLIPQEQPPLPQGTLYADDFTSGSIYNPQINEIGAYSMYAFGIQEGYGSGIVQHDGKTALKIVSIPDYPQVGLYNSGKYEVLWDTAIPDIYISWDAWIDSDYEQPTGISHAKQKMLALWEDVYGSGSGTDGGENRCYSVQNSNFGTPKRGMITIETTMVDTYKQSRGPWYFDPTPSESCCGCRNYLPCPVNEPPGLDYATFLLAEDLGKWVNLQWHVKLAQFAGDAGLFELWKDGVLVMSVPHDNFASNSTRLGYRRMYLYGNAGEGIVNQSSKYVANFRIGTESFL